MQPVSGAAVRMWFATRFDDGMDIKSGATSPDGQFAAEGFSRATMGSVEVRKDGYYLGFPEIPTFRATDDLGRWKPWGRNCPVVLRKIGIQRLMYARKAVLRLPKVDTDIGYDLTAGDYVGPYGKGQIPDLIFRTHRDVVGPYFKETLSCRFSNPEDGIMPAVLPPEFSHSQFKWPREAPATGYEPSFSSHLENLAAGLTGDIPLPRVYPKYFIRVRTIVKDGKLVSALYGRLTEGIRFEFNPTATTNVAISYYLNPDSMDRSTECSGSLFSSLRPDEHVEER